MYVEVAGTRLFIDVVGPSLVPEGRTMRSRPTVIVLHGGPGADHTVHRPGLDLLGEVAQVIYVDQRGQGRSDETRPEEWTLARWGEDVQALCEVLGIERPIVYGHSFGGMVAMAYGVRYLDKPLGLILSCTYATQNVERTARRCAELGGEEASQAARAMWSEPSVETQKRYDRTVLPLYMQRKLDAADRDAAHRVRSRSEVGLHFAAGEMQRFDFTDALSKIGCPTLVIGAERDPVCPIEDQEDIERALTNAEVRFERFESCAHVPWADEPERYYAVVRDFVAGLAAG